MKRNHLVILNLFVNAIFNISLSSNDAIFNTSI
jgi:hypothetical protein